jgi:hypothetical protein
MSTLNEENAKLVLDNLKLKNALEKESADKQQAIERLQKEAAAHSVTKAELAKLQPGNVWKQLEERAEAIRELDRSKQLNYNLDS